MALLPYDGTGPAIRRYFEAVSYPPFARVDYSRDPTTKEVLTPVVVLGYAEEWAVFRLRTEYPNAKPSCCPRSEIFKSTNPITD